MKEGFSTFFVPPGKEIVVKANGQNIFSQLPNANNIHLIIEGGISLGFKNNYTKLLDVKASSLLNLLSSSLTVNDRSPLTAQFALQGMEIWESTDNLSFNLDATLYMVNSGKEDVMIPSLNLISSTLPGTTKDEGAKGIWGNGLIPPGPNIAKILELSGATSEGIQEAVKLVQIGSVFTLDLKAATGTYDIELGGYMTIPNCVITNVQPTYSEQLDEDLFPVSCTLSIEFQTVEVATKEMIQTIIKSLPNNATPDVSGEDLYLKELHARHDE